MRRSWSTSFPTGLQASVMGNDHRWRSHVGPSRPAAPLRVAFSLDGPLRVDAEDLPSWLAAAVLTPRWLVEISAPEGTSDLVWKMANRVGRHLADEMEGVLFDPQHDRIAWPRSRQRPRFISVAFWRHR